MSANSLTQSVIKHLTACGFVVWRQNSAAVFDTKKQVFRKNPTQKKGISDVLGFCRNTGIIIAVEVKWQKDKLSEEQSEFLAAVERAGGIALVAKTIDGFLSDCKKLNIG